MIFCMRTTLRLDDRLLREAKRIAADSGKTLTAVIEDLLSEALARRRGRRRGPAVRLPTYQGRGLRPGVDLDDTAGLLELMEGGRAAD